MYLYDQGRVSSVPLRIGRLDGFGKSPKKKESDLVQAIELEAQMKRLRDKAINLWETERGDATGFWNGVSRNYEEWLKVRDETDPTKWRIFQIAADAAVHLGDAAAWYKRLWTALAHFKRDNGPLEKSDLEARDLMNDQIWRLSNYWAQVSIHLARGADRFLEAKSFAVTYGAIQAIALAKKKLADEGKFNNLLPLGSYILSGQQILIKDEWAWSRVWVVDLNQKQDGSFNIQPDPRRSASKLKQPLYIR